MSSQQEGLQLDHATAVKLTDFARAVKAAARAVTLYPPTHPAIRLSLARLVDASTRITDGGSITLGVTPDNLLVDGAASVKPDQTVREAGSLFHGHMIGLIRLHASPDPDAWVPFLQILAKPLDEVHAAGGVVRLWGATGQRHLEIEQIDYADILRERDGSHESRWDDIIRACLNPDLPLDANMLKSMLEICGDPDRFGEFVLTLEQNTELSLGSKASALLRMLRGVADLVARTDPAKLDPVLKNVAQGFGTLSPELALELLSTDQGRADKAADLVLQVAGRMTDATLGTFVARSVVSNKGATDRLAQAFQALVPEPDRKRSVLDAARAQAEQSPLAERDDFADLWKSATDMLTSYTDEQFVSESYARELSEARTQAIDVERVSDDPPERIGAWVGSVGPVEVRALDLLLLLDLLAIETDTVRWRSMTVPVVNHIEDLVLVGDFQGAIELTAILVDASRTEGPRQPAAADAIRRIVEGSTTTHIVSHLRSVDDASVEPLKKLCLMLGLPAVKPLAEALAVERGTVARHRFTEILLGFGADGRIAVEQLRASANPAVRRTAIHLLREFGGSDALPDLTALLNDTEPHVQREAVRAILSIGSEEAYGELQRALATGTNQTREALTGALVSMRSERAIPLFEYIVTKIDRRGPLKTVYLQAVESLGALKATQAVDMLKDALYSGEWWAPIRTSELRRAVAAALHQIGSADAKRVLDEAASSGPRGVRSAVKAVRS